jgi:hypothetical protein
MTEEQPIDGSPGQASEIPDPPAIVLPLERWEGEGGAKQTDELGPGARRPRQQSWNPELAFGRVTPVDPDAITERHFFLQSEDELKP